MRVQYNPSLGIFELVESGGGKLLNPGGKEPPRGERGRKGGFLASQDTKSLIEAYVWSRKHMKSESKKYERELIRRGVLRP